MVIANLTAPDVGPQSQYYWSNWQKKIVSSSSNNMLVTFISDHVRESVISEFTGFSASIHYSPIQTKECEASLDMTKKTLQFPNYFDSYDNNLSCKWLISVPYGLHITLNFTIFDVIFKRTSDFFYLFIF